MLTLLEAKAQLNIEGSDHDDEIQAYVAAVTAVVERQTGEVVTPREVEEHHSVRNRASLVLRSIPVLDVLDVSSLDGDTTWGVNDLQVTETGVLVSMLKPFHGRLIVTVHAGYNAVPPNYHLAALIILQHLWRVQRGPSAAAFGGGVSLPDSFSGFAVPRRAQELIGSMVGGIA